MPQVYDDRTLRVVIAEMLLTKFRVDHHPMRVKLPKIKFKTSNLFGEKLQERSAQGIHWSSN